MAEESPSSKAAREALHYKTNAALIYNQGVEAAIHVADSNMTIGGSHVNERRAAREALHYKTNAALIYNQVVEAATHVADSNMTIGGYHVNERRELKGVYQAEIITAFADITSFEKFARSKNGLCLDQSDIQTIVEDHGGNDKKQKLKMLFRWQEIQAAREALPCTTNAAGIYNQGVEAMSTHVADSNMTIGGYHVNERRGEKATVAKIRDLLQKYFRKENSSDYIVLGNGLFGVYKTRFLFEGSVVYLGEQISGLGGRPTQTRAIKFVPKNETNLREAQILVKLGNHVNVVSIIHAGIHHENPHDYIYIAMECIWTQTVRNMIEKCMGQQKLFHEINAWSLFKQLMKAVEFLHSYNIVHRDVKPNNVLASDDWRHFKLTAYRLTKEVEDGPATIQTNAYTGTTGYRSHETYDPNAKITVKVDIFAAGVTIVEIMANGRHPFGEDPDQWKCNIKNDKNLDLSHLCVSNKDQAVSLIKQMLEMAPEKRPAATEVLNKLSVISKAVNQRWKQIEGTDIKYDQESCYRKGSEVFNAIRKSGGKDQEGVVKFVKDFDLEDEKNRKKIQREIDNHWAAYIHKNVVTYFNSGNCEYNGGNAIFILMEKCDKKTLNEKIKEENLPYIERAEIVKCIAQGLQHLREKDILHRDLKPQNILYKDGIYVISDFGLSKTVSPNKSSTHKSGFVGTEGWSAPETYSDNAKSTFAADIYSAGLVFFFALTDGKHPYGNDQMDWQTYIKNNLNFNLKPLYDTPNGKVAYDLISLMLSRDPKERPAIGGVLKHPFFWNVEEKKNFYDDICRTIEYHSEKITGSRIFTLQYAKYLKEVETEKKDWKDKLLLTDAEKQNIEDNFGRRGFDITVEEDVMKGFATNRFAKNLSDSVTSMVHFIRNRFTHSSKDKSDEKIDFSNEELWKFFDSRYPYLFLYTYYASKEYYKTKPASDPDYLKKYFTADFKTPKAIKRKSTSLPEILVPK